MFAFLEAFRRLLAGLARLEIVLCVLLLGNVVVNIGAQVVSRYLFNYPLVWVEELATYSFIWGTFVGASVGLKYGRHVRIETFVGRLPRRSRAALQGLVYVGMLVLLVILLPEAWTVMGIEGRSRSVSLPWPVPRSWFYSIPMFVGCASMALTCLYLALCQGWAALGGGDMPPILPPPPHDADELQIELQPAAPGERGLP